MSKKTKTKTLKLKPFQKLLTIMVSGKPVTIEEIDSLLGAEIYMYRLSTYMWHIKTNLNGVVKAIKDGRRVTAYQLINVDEAKAYMKRVGITDAGFVPGQVVRAPSKAKAAKVSKLADLNAEPAEQVEQVEQAVEVTE